MPEAVDNLFADRRNVLILSAMRSSGDFSVALVLSAFLAVSCSDPQGGTLPTTSPSPSSSFESPTASAEPDATQLRRAVADYVSALNAALRDPKARTADVEGRIDPMCTCRDVVATLREVASQDRYIDYQYTLKNLSIQQVGELGGSVTFTINQTAGHARTADGRIVESYPASTVRYSAHFRRSGSAWLLDRLDEIK